MPDTQNLQTADDAALGIASEYDAFISYKHGPVDSAAAKALQKNLEHFHVPIIAGHAKGEKKRRKIKRVFLDEGELSATAAFASRIRLALKNSRWLIIICSPATKNSPWVDLEIRTFLEFHDRDHILAVMTSGEPADIFPEAFAGSGTLPDEMLAADARGKTAYDVVRKLRGDTLLRIAAPILELTYDDLKQRHRVYRLQRFLLAASLCLVAITGFLVYASVQNSRLSQSNRDIRLQQAQLITNESSAQLTAGNNVEAIRGLLHVVTDLSADDASQSPLFGESGTSEDVLPSSQYALTQALNLYVPNLPPNFEGQHIAPCAVLQGSDRLLPDLLSDSSGRYLLATDAKTVYVWNTASDQLIDEIPFDSTIRNWSEDALLDDGRIILCGDHSVVCYNLATGAMSWKATVLNEIRSVSRFRRSRSGAADAGAGSDQDDRLYLVSDTGLTVLGARSGDLLSEYRFTTGREDSLITSYNFNSGGGDDNAPLFGTVMSSSVSASGKYLLFTASEGFGPTSLYVHELEGGKTEKLDTVSYNDECYNAVTFLSEGAKDPEHVLYTKFENKDGECAVSLTSVALEYEDSALSPRTEWESRYPLTRQMRSYQAAGGRLGADSLQINILPDYHTERQTSILFACDDDLMLLSPEDGQVLYDSPLPAKVMKTDRSEKNCLLYLKSGNIYDFSNAQLTLYTNAFADDCNEIEKIEGKASFYCLRGKDTITHYAPDEPDRRFTALPSQEQSLPSRVLYQDEEWTVLGDAQNLFFLSAKDDTVHVLPLTELSQSASSGSGNSEASGAQEDASGTSAPLLGSDIKILRAQDGVIELLSTSSASSLNTAITLYRIRPEDWSLTSEVLLLVNSPINMANHVLYDPGNRMLYVTNSDGDATVIWTYGFETSKAVRHTLPLGYSCNFYSISPQGDRILLISEMELIVLNTQTWQIEYTISGAAYATNAIGNLRRMTSGDLICWDGRTLVVPESRKLHVYDSSGAEIHTIDCESNSADGTTGEYPLACLSPTGNYLYYLCGSTFVQYSLADGKKVNEVTLPDDADDTGAGDTFRVANTSGVGDTSRVVYFEPVTDRSLSRFRIGFPRLLSDRNGPEPDTLRVLYNRNFYCIRCDTEAFGVMTKIKDAAAYSPASGKIYLTSYNPKSGLYDYLYYREYSIQDIIDIARERYGSEP